MSLTSQLKKKTSPVRTFFEKYECSKGLNQCLTSIKDRRKHFYTDFSPAYSQVYCVIGIVIDYLIRYIGSAYALNLDKTIASKAVEKSKHVILDGVGEFDDWMSMFEILLQIAMSGLKGSKASSEQAIYSSTALAILDGFYRSQRLPKKIIDELHIWNKWEIKFTNKIKPITSEKVAYLIDFYIKTFSKDGYADGYYNEVADIISTFEDELKDKKGNLYGITFEKFNEVLKNSNLVGGADYDCILKSKNRFRGCPR